MISIDPALIAGKIAALHPALELMAEMTGAPVTATKAGYYAEYFTLEHISINTANDAVRELMGSWQKGYWPSPETIGARAKEIARRESSVSGGVMNHWAALEEHCEREAAHRWEHRVEEANQWRVANSGRFKTLIASIDQQIGRMIRAWSTDSRFATSAVYRKHFREGSAVGACLRKAGDDARAAERELAKAQKRAAAEAQAQDNSLNAA